MTTLSYFNRKSSASVKWELTLNYDCFKIYYIYVFRSISWLAALSHPYSNSRSSEMKSAYGLMQHLSNYAHAYL
jgi:hypothetical protein